MCKERGQLGLDRPLPFAFFALRAGGSITWVAPARCGVAVDAFPGEDVFSALELGGMGLSPSPPRAFFQKSAPATPASTRRAMNWEVESR